MLEMWWEVMLFFIFKVACKRWRVGEKVFSLFKVPVLCGCLGDLFFSFLFHFVFISFTNQHSTPSIVPSLQPNLSSMLLQLGAFNAFHDVICFILFKIQNLKIKNQIKNKIETLLFAYYWDCLLFKIQKIKSKKIRIYKLKIRLKIKCKI